MTLKDKVKVELPDLLKYYDEHVKKHEFDRPALITWREIVVEPIEPKTARMLRMTPRCCSPQRRTAARRPGARPSHSSKSCATAKISPSLPKRRAMARPALEIRVA